MIMYSYVVIHVRMAEWSKAPDLRSGPQNEGVGSNPHF